MRTGITAGGIHSSVFGRSTDGWAQSLRTPAHEVRKERETSSRLNSRMECEEDKPISTVLRQMQSTLTLGSESKGYHLPWVCAEWQVVETHYETFIAG